VGTPDEGDGTAHIPPETPASASGEQVTAASGRRARMTSAEVGFTSPDEVPPKRRTAVSLVLAAPERRRRRTAVLPDVRHLTRKERASIGKDARGNVPRSAHAELDLCADRPDPIALLQSQARTRVPELVPIRYGRMLESEFAFFRGAALVMASDLSRTPVTGIHAQLCGDAHLSNFGLFASPERRVVFDINDFDETLPGPWEWDLKRLAASFEIAGRENGLPARTRRPIVARRRRLPRGDGRVRHAHQPDGLVRTTRCRAVHRRCALARAAAHARPRHRSGGAFGREGPHP
jgi:hypothetical protein